MSEACARVFIVGVGRSGTSLLQSMLAAHPLLTFPPETSFLRRFVVPGKLRAAAKKGGIAAARAALLKDEHFRRTGMSVDEVVSGESADGDVSDMAVYRSMLRLQTKRAGKPFAGDKDPRAIEFLGVINDVLPGSHAVHVIRDPRDVLVSRKKADWSRRRNVASHVFANRVQMALGRSEGPAIFGPRYHEVVYEELLGRPEAVLKSLCRRMGFPYEVRMLEFSAAAKELVSQEELPWKGKTLGPLIANNKGMWAQALEPWEVALVESCNEEAFAAGGYARSEAAMMLGLGQRLRIALLAAGIKLLSLPYLAFRRWKVRQARRRL